MIMLPFHHNLLDMETIQDVLRELLEVSTKF